MVNYSGLNPIFAARISAAIADAEKATGGKAVVTSAYRTYADQVAAWNNYQHGGGLAARPGKSLHEQGMAFDLGPGPVRNWMQAHATQYGLEAATAADRKRGTWGADTPHIQLARDTLTTPYDSTPNAFAAGARALPGVPVDPFGVTAAKASGTLPGGLPSPQTLRQGMRGATKLQQALKARGFNPGPVDDIYGPRTTRAVRALERATPGLTRDRGIAGPQVLGALGIGLPKPMGPEQPGATTLPAIAQPQRPITPTPPRAVSMAGLPAPPSPQGAALTSPPGLSDLTAMTGGMGQLSGSMPPSPRAVPTSIAGPDPLSNENGDNAVLRAMRGGPYNPGRAAFGLSPPMVPGQSDSELRAHAAANPPPAMFRGPGSGELSPPGDTMPPHGINNLGDVLTTIEGIPAAYAKLFGFGGEPATGAPARTIAPAVPVGGDGVSRTYPSVGAGLSAPYAPQPPSVQGYKTPMGVSIPPPNMAMGQLSGSLAGLPQYASGGPFTGTPNDQFGHAYSGYPYSPPTTPPAGGGDLLGTPSAEAADITPSVVTPAGGLPSPSMYPGGAGGSGGPGNLYSGFTALPAPPPPVSAKGSPEAQAKAMIASAAAASPSYGAGGGFGGGYVGGGSGYSAGSSPYSGFNFYARTGTTPWGTPSYTTPSGGFSNSSYTPPGYTPPSFDSISGGPTYAYHPDGMGGGTYVTSSGTVMTY